MFKIKGAAFLLAVRWCPFLVLNMTKNCHRMKQIPLDKKQLDQTKNEQEWDKYAFKLTGTGLKIKRIYDGVEAETRKSQASFQIIQVSSEALPRMRPE